MANAQKVNEPCPECGDDEDVWVFEKPEGSVTKNCYSCEACGTEWTEIASK